MSKNLWLLDAGHGDTTPGKRSPVLKDGRQLMEFEYVRKIRHAMIPHMARLGINYNFVSHGNADMSLLQRASVINDIARKNTNAVCISIHANAAGNGTDWHSASGYEVFTSKGFTRSDEIAEFFYMAMKASKLFRMRQDTEDGDHDREANYYMLKKTICPAILTESGFYTNEEEVEKMFDDAFIEKVAVAHIKGICAYDGIAFNGNKVVQYKSTGLETVNGLVIQSKKK